MICYEVDMYICPLQVMDVYSGPLVYLGVYPDPSNMAEGHDVMEFLALIHGYCHGPAGQ